MYSATGPVGNDSAHTGETMNGNFRASNRRESFRHALAGIGILVRTQRNAWIHAAATLAVVAAGLALGVSAPAWCWLVAAIAAVWTAEALNTALEFLADAASPEFHPLVKKSKDVAAAAVLIAAMGAAAIGLLVLGPYVMAWVG